MNTTSDSKTKLLQRVFNRAEVLAIEREELRQLVLERFQRFIKRIGYPHYVGIPIGVHFKGAPAYISPVKISVQFKLAKYHLDKLDIYFAHELMHAVIHEFRAWHDFSHSVANRAEDLRINYLILELWGLDVRKAPIKGIFDQKLGKLSVIEICKQLESGKRVTSGGQVWAPAFSIHPEIWKVAEWIKEQLLGKKDECLLLADTIDKNAYWPVVPALALKLDTKIWPAVDLRQVLMSCFMLGYQQKPVFSDTHTVFGKKITPTKQIVHGYVPDELTALVPEAASAAAYLYVRNVYHYDDYIKRKLNKAQIRYKSTYKLFMAADKEIRRLKTHMEKVPRALSSRRLKLKTRLLIAYVRIQKLADLAKYPISRLLRSPGLVLDPPKKPAIKVARLGVSGAAERLQKASKRPSVRPCRLSRALKYLSRDSLKSIRDVVNALGSLEALAGPSNDPESDMQVRRSAENVSVEDQDIYEQVAEDLATGEDQKQQSPQQQQDSDQSPSLDNGSNPGNSERGQGSDDSNGQQPNNQSTESGKKPGKTPGNIPGQGRGGSKPGKPGSSSDSATDSETSGANVSGSSNSSNRRGLPNSRVNSNSSRNQSSTGAGDGTGSSRLGSHGIQIAEDLQAPDPKDLQSAVNQQLGQQQSQGKPQQQQTARQNTRSRNEYSYEDMKQRLNGVPQLDRQKAIQNVAANDKAIQMLLRVRHYANLFDTMLNITSRKPKDTSTNVDTILEYGSNLTSVESSELALLRSQPLVFFKNLADHSLLQRTPIDNKKDPIALLIDVSGSMQGEPYSMVCGFTIALAKRMCSDKRGLFVALFDTRVVLEIEAMGSINVMKLIQELLTAPTWGGTEFENPLRAAVAWGKRRNFSRMITILLTDGHGAVDDREREIRGFKRVSTFVMVKIGSAARSKAELPKIQQEIFDEVIPIQRGGELKGIASVGKSVL